jgi:diacylglycerol kinase (ATP)
LLPAVRAAFSRGSSEIVTTAHSSDEQSIAVDAMRKNFTTIVCVGGDGTCNNVANAVLHSSADVRLGVIPAGTGNDFARTLGVDRMSVESIAELAFEGCSSRMDVGRIEERFFLNSCGFGFDVAVLQGLARVRWISNDMVYIYSALQQILGFGGLKMSISSEVTPRQAANHLLVVLANGSRFGGGLAIAPTATVTDGMIDAVMIRDASRARRLRMLAAASRGTHSRFGEVITERAGRFTLELDDLPFYEIDGEVYQARSRSLIVECIPKALGVITATL